MGTAGACANYFSDEFGSVVLVLGSDVLACADGQDIGSVAVELPRADARDPRQLARFLGGGLGDRDQGLVGEDAERGLPGPARLDRAPGPQPLVESLVHVRGTVLATH